MFQITNPQNIPQPIHSISATPMVPVGTIVNGYDGIQGAGEFCYMIGVASTVAGSLVTYDHLFQTTLDAATANFSAPKAVAMAPTLAGQYGWYQVSGTALVANNATAVAGNAFAKASGQIGSAAVAGTQIMGARIAVANGTTFTKVGTTKNGSTQLWVPNFDGLFVGLPVSGTGIAGGSVIAAGVDGGPNASNTNAAGMGFVNLNNAMTADGTVTVTFTRTNFSLVQMNRPSGQGQIT